MDSRMVGIIPSYSAEIGELRHLSSALRSVGIRAYVVPTSKSLSDQVQSSDVECIRLDSNPGFGASVEAAVGQLEGWDWLFIFNDDVSIDPSELRSTLDEHVQDPNAETVVLLDDTPPKSIPGILATLMQVSLLQPIFSRMGFPRGGPQYRPFSAVAISKALWDRNRGFDARLLYTFEDADFVRRTRAGGGAVLLPLHTGVLHRSHGTSRRHMDKVLPVAMWSARAYLCTLGVPRSIATLLVLLALMVRVPLSLGASASKASHFRGIVRSWRCLVLGVEPSLPEFTTP